MAPEISSNPEPEAEEVSQLHFRRDRTPSVHWESRDTSDASSKNRQPISFTFPWFHPGRARGIQLGQRRFDGAGPAGVTRSSPLPGILVSRDTTSTSSSSNFRGGACEDSLSPNGSTSQKDARIWSSETCRSSGGQHLTDSNNLQGKIQELTNKKGIGMPNHSPSISFPKRSGGHSPANPATVMEPLGEYSSEFSKQSRQTLANRSYQLQGERGMNVPDRQTTQSPAKFSGPPRAWVRFPSHSRAERNGPAGLADGVVSKDFSDMMMPQAQNGTQINKAPIVPSQKTAPGIGTMSGKIGRKMKSGLKKIHTISVDVLKSRQRGQEKARAFEDAKLDSPLFATDYEKKKSPRDETDLAKTFYGLGQGVVSYSAPSNVDERTVRVRLGSSLRGIAPATPVSPSMGREGSSTTTEEYLTASSRMSQSTSRSNGSGSLSFQSDPRGDRRSRDIQRRDSSFTDQNPDAQSVKSDSTVIRRSRLDILRPDAFWRGASATYQGRTGARGGLTWDGPKLMKSAPEFGVGQEDMAFVKAKYEACLRNWDSTRGARLQRAAVEA